MPRRNFPLDSDVYIHSGEEDSRLKRAGLSILLQEIELTFQNEEANPHVHRIYGPTLLPTPAILPASVLSIPETIQGHMKVASVVSVYCCLHVLTLGYGFQKIKLVTIANTSNSVLDELGIPFKLTNEDVLEVVAKIGVLSSKEGDSLTISKPISFHPFGSSAKSGPPLSKQYERILDSVRAKLRELYPQPVFLAEQLERCHARIQSFNALLEERKKTEFVATAGDQENTIHEKIVDIIENSKSNIKMMMAFANTQISDLLTRMIRENLLVHDSFRFFLVLRNETSMYEFLDKLYRAIQVKVGKEELENVKSRINVAKVIPRNQEAYEGQDWRNVHAKLLLADDSRMLCSSANLSYYSLHLNYEAGVYSEDPLVVNKAVNFFDSIFRKHFAMKWEEDNNLEY